MQGGNDLKAFLELDYNIIEIFQGFEINIFPLHSNLANRWLNLETLGYQILLVSLPLYCAYAEEVRKLSKMTGLGLQEVILPNLTTFWAG